MVDVKTIIEESQEKMDMAVMYLEEAMNIEKSIWRVAVAPMKMPSHKKAENPARGMANTQ